MVTKYLSLQKDLYDICPECCGSYGKERKTSKCGENIIHSHRDADIGRRIARLTSRLNKIKSDILFDNDEAAQRWAEIQIDLAKEAAERKRFGFRAVEQKMQTTSPTSANSTDGRGALQDEDVSYMLGDMFNLSLDTTADQDDKMTGLSSLDRSGELINIRDFGAWTGINPRRVLEESYKLRQVMVQYDILSNTNDPSETRLPG